MGISSLTASAHYTVNSAHLVYFFSRRRTSERNTRCFFKQAKELTAGLSNRTVRAHFPAEVNATCDTAANTPGTTGAMV